MTAYRAPAVGARASLSRTIAPEDIELFTRISGDRNPLHYDREVAERSRFGGIIVQGGVTTAVLNAVVAERLPGPGTVFLSVAWDFRAAAAPGDTITGHVEVTAARSDTPVTHLRTWVTNQDDVVLVEGTAVTYTVTVGEH